MTDKQAAAIEKRRTKASLRALVEWQERFVQEACAFAFDLGREEAKRARESMLVEMDRWLEEGKHLAEVSDEALCKELRGRLAESDAKAHATMLDVWQSNVNSPAGFMSHESILTALNRINPPPDIRDVLPPGESVTVNGVVFTGNPRPPGYRAYDFTAMHEALDRQHAIDTSDESTAASLRAQFAPGTTSGTKTDPRAKTA